MHDPQSNPSFMFVGRAQIYAFALGSLSALTVSVVVFVLQGNNDVWKNSVPISTIITSRDAVDYAGQQANASRIPNVVHQSWINTSVPEHFSSWRQSWVKNHRLWEFKLWTDEDNDALVKRYAPWFLSRYEEYSEPVMRADAVRYLYMYRC